MLSGFSEHSPRRCLCVFLAFVKNTISPLIDMRLQLSDETAAEDGGLSTHMLHMTRLLAKRPLLV